MREDDLFELLMKQQAQPEGSYNHQVWELVSKGNPLSEQALIVSVHESTHHLLNNTTAYGLWLIVLAQLVRDDVVEEDVLSMAVHGCRQAHEVYASYIGLLHVEPKYLDGDCFEHMYPGYGQYIEVGKLLLKGVKIGHLQYPLLNAAIRFCMQSGLLTRQLTLGKWLEYDYADAPSKRLKKLYKAIDSGFWPRVLQEFKTNHCANQTMQVYLEGTDEQEIETAIGTERYDACCSELNAFAYDELKALLPTIPTMQNNEHLNYIEQLLACVDETFPQLSGVALQKADEQLVSALSQFEAETIVYQSEPKVAVIVDFDDFPQAKWDQMLASVDNTRYLYVVSRITEKFVEQYQFDQNDKDKLLSEHPDFVVSIVVRQTLKHEQETVEYLLFIVLESEAQLQLLEQAHYSMLSSTSMLLTADEHWQSWHECLLECSSQTVLFDLSPSTHLLTDFSIFDQVEYQKFELSWGNGNYIFVVLIGRYKQSASGVFLLPCSEVMAQLLLNFIDQKCPSFERLDTDNPDNRELVWLLNIQMSRLLDETRFDFKALSCDYAKRCMEEKRF